MSAQDLNQKYTLNHYATKLEVSKGIGTNLVEPFWCEIVLFRERFSQPLPIKDTNGSSYTLTYIDPINKRQFEISNRVARLISLFNELVDGSIAKKTLVSEMLKSSLKSIAKVHRIDASEITLTSIISGQQTDETYLPLVRYLNALETFKYHTNNQISEDFLAEYYAMLRGEEELSCFYRLNDNVTASSMSLVDREYDNGVPARFIETMMSQLIEYLNDSNVSPVNKVVLTFYMFNYIKPFDLYNDELASLVAKSILAKEDLNIAATYIPLESFLCDTKFYTEITREVQKLHDFTYAFLAGSTLLDEAFTTILDRIVQVNSKTIVNEITIGNSQKEFKKEFGIEIPKENFEEEKKTVVSPQIKTNPVQQKHKEIVSEKKSDGLSDKELRAKEDEMVESNPFINKKQAHFYLHHNTKGRFYTIQQYKKFIGCVYETARTSMDNLALQGYYRKENIKNKFVYTPIDKE